MNDPSTYRAARDHGGEYLLSHCRSDGGVGSEERGVADYYKVTSALQVCGENSAANRLCQWIRRHGITPEGDFGPRSPETCGYPYAYYNSWVILGAHRLGQLDLSSRGMEFLLSFRDSESGGFFSSLTEHDNETSQDIWVVSGCGQAALAMGHIDVALGVGEWMATVMRQQPNFPQELFSVYSRARGLYTTVDPTDPIRYVAHQNASGDQYVFNPGIAAGFLCRLYQATSQIQWLELAKEYMRFAEGMDRHLFKLLRAGKVGWAASLLLTLTGEEKYADLARRVGDDLLETQKADGSWTLFGGYQVDVTAEMVFWLDEIQQALTEYAGRATTTN